MVRSSGTTAVVTPPTGPAFAVAVRSERRRLIELRTITIQVRGPATDIRDATVRFHHRGQVRRTGLAPRLRGRESFAARPVLDRLLADGELEAASLALDFTRFELRPRDGVWCVTLELMGGSHVRTRLPPSSHYVRLTEDQLDALLATVRVLHARLPGHAPCVLPAPPIPDPARRVRRAESHLPRRR